ncbi:MAG: SDR family NAD(P)-dependent oxidoreductase [Chloroflexi bacterium]|nr:SDR family NAD(P)-dependent oxidoreductase [Chloroflexota bacterium]
MLEGKVILIVGGASGIGRATAELCVRRGARVIVADYNATDGAAAAAACGAEFVQVNVADENSVQQMAAQVDAKFGRLDGLVQTAGVLKGPFIDIEKFELDMFREVLEINLVGSFLCAKHSAPLMRRAGGGVIVLISSAAAYAGSSSYAYGSSKGGVSGLGITLANKLAPENIRVNVVAPGNIETPMKRSVIDADVALNGPQAGQAQLSLGTPEGVARILAWLVSDDADYVRGLITTR